MKIKIAVVCLCCICGFAALVHAASSIALKVVAVNPSKDLSQKVQVKAFLPKEAKPEDIIDKGDLNISYDTQQGSYFVFNEYELRPEETMERTIEIRDIWNIPDAEIASALQEADKMTELLKNTEFQERAKFLLSSIQDKLKRIQENQANPAPNPDRHISDYRDNAKIFETVKTDMAMIRSFLSLAKPLPPIVIWRAIVIIMFFLGGLGVAFYFIWQKQLKHVVSDDTFYVPGNQPQDKPKDQKKAA